MQIKLFAKSQNAVFTLRLSPMSCVVRAREGAYLAAPGGLPPYVIRLADARSGECPGTFFC